MSFKIGSNCRIHDSCSINVKKGYLGDGAVLCEEARIEGYCVEIGREAYIGPRSTIAGIVFRSKRLIAKIEDSGDNA